MANITLPDAEARLLIELLELASDSFSNHGCNDFDLTKSVPDLEDRRALMKRYNDYNGSLEDFEYDEEHGSQYELDNDSALMSYLARRIEEQLDIDPDASGMRKVILDADLELGRSYEQDSERGYYGGEE